MPLVRRLDGRGHCEDRRAILAIAVVEIAPGNHQFKPEKENASSIITIAAVRELAIRD
jgi:hypothetical protein